MTVTITATAISDRSANTHVNRTLTGLTGDQVPVAAVALELSGKPIEFRWADGKFYRLRIDRDAVKARMQSDGAVSVTWHRDDSADAGQKVQARLEEYALIDGALWHQTPEPAFILGTLGQEITVGNPQYSAPWRVYAMTEYDAARDAAASLRAEKGVRGFTHRSVREAPGHIVLPEAFTGPLHAERLEAVHARAAAAVADVISKLQVLTPESVHEAAAILCRADDEFTSGTSGFSWLYHP